ncbi:MAG: hypothetical protein BGO39_08670 [Chloroflexi bacterium 54-19]|nr:MAG: hypothetical protein BGO39_08670 [Chloroflexi bacterium 54-19]
MLILENSLTSLNLGGVAISGGSRPASQDCQGPHHQSYDTKKNGYQAERDRRSGTIFRIKSVLLGLLELLSLVLELSLQ